MSILHKLRGHDTEITSIDWIKLSNCTSSSNCTTSNCTSTDTSTVATRTKKVAKSQSRRKPQPIVDSGDMFDIHSFDYLENEFGTLSNVNRIQEEPKQHLNIQNNESFDFVEACQSLKEDILRPTNPEADEENEVHRSDIPEAGSDGSDRSDCRSEDFVDVNQSLRQLDLEDRDHKSPMNKPEADTILSVVTASREPFFWIWDLNSGAALEKISYKTSHKASDIKFQGRCLVRISFPKCLMSSIYLLPGLTAKWIDEKTIVTNSPNGDIRRHSVSFTDKKYENHFRYHFLRKSIEI